MRKIIRHIVSFIIFCQGFLFAFPQPSPSLVKIKVGDQIIHDLIFFRQQNLLQKQKLPSRNQRMVAFQNTRFAYKNVEYVFNTYNSVFFRSINGPNLGYDGFKGGVSQLYAPHGLQTMEELLFTEPFDSVKYLVEIERLNEQLDHLIKKGNELAGVPEESFHHIIWESIKFEIYRIEALGITGFDTPLSEWGIVELVPALKGIEHIVILYSGTKYLEQNTKRKLLKLLKEAVRYVQIRDDFDSFDRLFFIREYLHPVSECIHDVQLSNDWTNSARTCGVNPLAKNLWDVDFLSKDFFRSEFPKEVIAIGKKLFFDKKLSPLNNRSCASCHNSGRGFADSVSFNNTPGGSFLSRNTPGLWNSVFQTFFFADGRRFRFEEQFYEVIHDANEMASSVDYIVMYLQTDSVYSRLFERAFNKIPDKFSLYTSLRAYLSSLVSLDSGFDKYMRKEIRTISPGVKNGFNLFTGKAKCATCHFLPMFGGLAPPFYDESEFEVLGVPMLDKSVKVTDKDLGRYNHTRSEIHRGAFKTVTVRNSNLTAPYMHNGVFSTLREVIEFYNTGGGNGNRISTPGQTLPSDSLHLSEPEINDIIRFIESLEDTTSVH